MSVVRSHLAALRGLIGECIGARIGAGTMDCCRRSCRRSSGDGSVLQSPAMRLLSVSAVLLSAASFGEVIIMRLRWIILFAIFNFPALPSEALAMTVDIRNITCSDYLAMAARRRVNSRLG